MAKAPPAMTIGPIARPSSPSVRFTAFEAPTTTSSANGNHHQPRLTSQPLKNGMASTGCQSARGCQNTICSKASVSSAWSRNFTRADRPRRFLILLQSSHMPIRPKPAVLSMATHT